MMSSTKASDPLRLTCYDKLREIDILIIQLDVTVLGSRMCLTHPFSAFNRRKKNVIMLLFHEIIEHTTSMCMHPTLDVFLRDMLCERYKSKETM
jgi:hypothetical protein